MMLRTAISNVDSSTIAQGFMEDKDDFDRADYPDVAKVEDEFPHCLVMPLSQLTVNETGVDNGDITYFSASSYVSKINGQNPSCCAIEARGGGGGEQAGHSVCPLEMRALIAALLSEVSGVMRIQPLDIICLTCHFGMLGCGERCARRRTRVPVAFGKRHSLSALRRNQ